MTNPANIRPAVLGRRRVFNSANFSSIATDEKRVIQLFNVGSHKRGEGKTKRDLWTPEANLFAAGTLGEHMSFLTEVIWAENPDDSSRTELEHASLHINSRKRVCPTTGDGSRVAGVESGALTAILRA